MIPSATLQDFLRSRRSVRRFRPDPVDSQVVERILTTAIQAASAHNRQPWRFAVVVDPSVKDTLATAMASAYEQDLIADGMSSSARAAALERARSHVLCAPLVVILCMDLSDMDAYADEKRMNAERVMAVQSVANAGTTILLSAHAEGLGAVWNCAPLFAADAVSRTLKLPRSWNPQAMLLVGYPSKESVRRSRRPLREVTLYR